MRNTRNKTITAVATLGMVLGLMAAGFVGRAEAAPAECADPCTVTATGAGYTPPAVLIANGGQVRWDASGGSHPTADTGITQCFLVQPGSTPIPVPVQFDHLGAGVVQATTAPGTPGASTKTCSDGIELPDGTALLLFNCEIHPHMVGAIRIGA